ncbi:DUF4232 domain-containing protein [Cellulomonas iranensis]|uniref:DUF4232 domain-containing protein n=1 Tax=Cellulomonas iranensis TaxID=76862 RepID=UPI003D7DAA81
MSVAPPTPPAAPGDGPHRADRAPGAPAAGAPDTTHRRRSLAVAVAVLVLAVVAALLLRVPGVADRLPGAAGCATVDGDPRPPAALRAAAREVRDALAGATDELAVTCRFTGPDDADGTDPGADPARWQLGVDAGVAQASAVPDLASAVLAAADPGAPWTWWLGVHGTQRTLEVVLTPGGDAAPATAAAAVLAASGATSVWVGPESAHVLVASGDQVAGAVRAVDAVDLPPTTVGADHPWVEVRQVHAGAWPGGEAVALAVDVAGWEGVYRVVLTGGAPASASLTVETEADAYRSEVARRLDALVQPGEPVAYDVRADDVGVPGTVGSGGVAPAPAPTPGATVDGVAVCPGDALAVEVTGTDAAAGSRFLFLRATNAGATPCALAGVPALAFTRASGTPVPDLTQLVDVVAPDAPPTTVLAPGDAADAQVRWGAMSTTNDPDVAVRVTVRPVPGGPDVDLALPTPLDVLAGATVRVGPWRPAQDPAAAP